MVLKAICLSHRAIRIRGGEMTPPEIAPYQASKRRGFKLLSHDRAAAIESV
jgi:hypothetical protein